MRIFKWLCLGGLLIAFLTIGGAVVFFATFDVDHLRPTLLNKLGTYTNRRIELSAIERSWSGGLGLTLKRFVIYDDAAFGAEPFFVVESARVQLKLMALLKRQVEIANLTIDQPDIRVIKNGAGHVNVETLLIDPTLTTAVATDVSVVQGPSSPASPPTAMALTLLVTAIQISDASVTYQDQSVTPATDVRIRHADIAVTDITFLDGIPQATLTVDDAVAEVSLLRVPLTRLGLTMSVTPTRAKVSARGELGRGNVNLTATVEEYRSTPRIDAEIHVSQLALMDVSPPHIRNAKQHVEGAVSGDLRLHGVGKDAKALRRSLTGDLAVTLADGKITGLNVLREALSKFSMLPGLIDRVYARLPARYQDMLADEDTFIRRMEMTGRIAQEHMQVDPLQVTADALSLAGRGRVEFTGLVDLRSWVTVPADLSAAMISSLNELKSLTDQSGQITFPLRVAGQAPQIAVQPDKDYITKRVVTTAGVDLLHDLLRGGRKEPATDASTPAAGAGAAQTTNTQQTEPLSKDERLIRGVLGVLLGGSEPAPTRQTAPPQTGTVAPPGGAVSTPPASPQPTAEEQLLRSIFGD